MSRLTEYDLRTGINFRDPPPPPSTDSGGGGADDPLANLSYEELKKAYYEGRVVNGVKVTEDRFITAANALGIADSQINMAIDNKPSGSSGATVFEEPDDTQLVAEVLAGVRDKSTVVPSQMSSTEFDRIVKNNTKVDGSGYYIDFQRAIDDAAATAPGPFETPPGQGAQVAQSQWATSTVPPGVDPSKLPTSGSGTSSGGTSSASGGGSGSSEPPKPQRKYTGMTQAQLIKAASSGAIPMEDLVNELLAMGRSREAVDVILREAGLSYQPGAGNQIGTLGMPGDEQSGINTPNLAIYENEPDFSQGLGTAAGLSPVAGTTADVTGVQLSGSLGNNTGFGFGSQAGLDLNYFNRVQQARQMAGLAPGEQVNSEFRDALKALMQYPEMQTQPVAGQAHGAVNRAGEGGPDVGTESPAGRGGGRRFGRRYSYGLPYRVPFNTTATTFARPRDFTTGTPIYGGSALVRDRYARTAAGAARPWEFWQSGGVPVMSQPNVQAALMQLQANPGATMQANGAVNRSGSGGAGMPAGSGTRGFNTQGPVAMIDFAGNLLGVAGEVPEEIVTRPLSRRSPRIMDFAGPSLQSSGYAPVFAA